MEFKDKMQRLRNDNKLTQEQLAEKLYVSRTAISKWESGKGYPNIDTLKDIAKLFNVTIDELLSSHEIIDIAKQENLLNIKRINNLTYGLLDIVSILLILLPLYAQKANDFIYSVPLKNTSDLNSNIKILIIIILAFMTLIGIVELLLNFMKNKKIQKNINILSLLVQSFATLFFIASRQTYLTLITFVILIIKGILLFRNSSNKKSII